MIKVCEKCGVEFSTFVVIDGKKNNLHRRRYCFDCHPARPHTVPASSERYYHCVVCGTRLKGNQRKYCSLKCKTHNLSSYFAQKDRSIARKLRLVEMAGGVCSQCGYQKNLAALEFHHIDPDTKKFAITGHNLANRTWRAVLGEFKKCILLCGNCHAELHYPDMTIKDLLAKFEDLDVGE